MPYKNPEDRRAANRRHYARHREEVIAKVAAYKQNNCTGTCRNCGGPTHGDRKGKIPEWCIDCRSAQFKLRANDFAEYRLLGSRAIDEYKKGGELFLVDSFRQRDALRKDLSKEKIAVERTLDNMRSVQPFDVALDRDEYDKVLNGLKIAKASLGAALDLIDEVSNRKE